MFSPWALFSHLCGHGNPVVARACLRYNPDQTVRCGKDTASVVSALTKQVRKLPLELRQSLTWDRGTEMAQSHHPWRARQLPDVHRWDNRTSVLLHPALSL